MKSKLIELLAQQKYVCITCDVWSSRAQAYIGMTVHFLTNDFDRKSYVLSFKQMKGKQTNKELSEEMDRTIREYGLDTDKVVNIVTDGCAAFTKSFIKFGTKDALASTHECEIDEVPNDELCTERSDMPFIQNEDGELFVSNVITLDSVDPISINNNDEREVDPIEQDYGTHGVSSPFSLVEDLLLSNQEQNNETQRAIKLPEQRRCLSHLINLTSNDFEKFLPSEPKCVLIGAANKLHSLWVRTHRSSNAKTICKEVCKNVSTELMIKLLYFIF